MKIPSNAEMRYLVYKSAANNKTKGYWYARAYHNRTLTFNQFIDHVSEHSSLYDRSICTGVMYKMLDCLIEMILNGTKVQLGDLGTFYCSMHTKGADKLDDFNLNDRLRGLSINFKPSATKESYLTASTLAGKVHFRELSAYESTTEKKAKAVANPS